MAITVTKTIGTTGRDYTTLAAWEAGEQGDLVALDEVHVGECYADTAFTAGVSISGSVTDATRFMHLKAATGQEHLGVPGAGVVVSVDGLNVIDVVDNFTIVEGVEVDGGAVGTAGAKTGINITGGNVICRSNIVHGIYTSFFTVPVRGIVASNVAQIQIYNNLIYDIQCTSTTNRASTTIGLLLNSDNIVAYYNTVMDVIDPNPGTVEGRGLNTPAGGVTGFVIKNNSVMDSGRFDLIFSSFNGTSTNNMDSDGTMVGTANQLNKLSANQFVNPAGNDYHLKIGADAIGNGTPIAGITTDIAGVARDAVTPDIGAFEFVGGGGPIPLQILRRRREGY